MQFPGPVRAVVGLLANAADEAKHLPDRAIELPMLAVSTALQLSLRAQQRYARLAARGEGVLNRRTPGEEPPPWATFDEPVPLDELAAGPSGDAAAERARAASELLDSLFGLSDDAQPSSNGTAEAAAAAPVKKAPVKKAPAKKAPVKKAPAKKAPAKKAPAGSKSVSKPRHTPPSRFDDADDD